MKLAGLVLALAVWFTAGYIAAARIYHFFQADFPILAERDRDRDWRRAVRTFFGGVISLMASELFSLVVRGHRRGYCWNWYKKPIIPVLLLLLMFTAGVQAQTTPIASVGVTAGVGSTALVFGGGVEHVFTPFEAHGYGSYLRGWKTDTRNTSFHQFSGKVRGVWWFTGRVGVIGGLRTQHGWTASYSKTQYEWDAGAAVKVSDDFRLYTSYIHQFANGIDSKGVESNRLRGFDIIGEMAMWPVGPVETRLAVSFQVFHGLNQGNPVCDGSYGGPVTCPRSSWWSHGASAIWSFEF